MIWQPDLMQDSTVNTQRLNPGRHQGARDDPAASGDHRYPAAMVNAAFGGKLRRDLAG
jgi:hypothetical protein